MMGPDHDAGWPGGSRRAREKFQVTGLSSAAHLRDAAEAFCLSTSGYVGRTFRKAAAAGAIQSVIGRV